MSGMKIFDRLLGLAEKHLPKILLPLLDRAHLFEFPGLPGEVLQKEYTDEERAFVQEHFFLPFDTVAIEDGTSCIILMDQADGQMGLSTPRIFLECLPFDSHPGDRDTPEVLEALKGMQARGLGNACVLSMGTLEMIPHSRLRWYLKGQLSHSWTVTTDKMIISAEESREEWEKDPQFSQAALEAVLPNVSTAMQEIMYFNRPDRFIIEDTPKIYDKKMAQRRKTGKRRPLRSHERPIYVLATPEEAQEKFGFSTGGGKKAHARRRHYRTLENERFARDEKGQPKKVVVKAAWIGPEEVESPNKKRRYRVRLDK